MNTRKRVDDTVKIGWHGYSYPYQKASVWQRLQLSWFRLYRRIWTR